MTVRVLLIDDHAIVREAVVHLLSSDPALSVVACAADAASGLRLAQEHRPE
ncbi:MAG TPA: response regulator, partial [Candidatus Acetothermia bacterium]|nr:response regulator [Candidatus Acetothermia bacterium]